MNTRFFLAVFAKALRPRWFAFAAVLLLLGLGTWLGPLPSLLLGRFVDAATGSPETALLTLALSYPLALLAAAVVDRLRDIAATVFGQEMLLQTRRHMAHHLAEMPLAYLQRAHIGAVMTPFTGSMEVFASLFSAGPISALADLFKMISALFALYLFSPAFAGVALAFVLPAFLLGSFFRRRFLSREIQLRTRTADVNRHIQELFSGFKLIKTHGGENFFLKRFRGIIQQHRQAMNESAFYSTLFPSLLQILRGLAVAAVIHLAWRGESSGGALPLSLGSLAAALDLLARLFDPLENVFQEWQQAQRAISGLDRAVHLLKQPREEREYQRLDIIPQHIELRIDALSFAFRAEGATLHEIDLQVPAGGKAALIGRSGSGKTSLLYLIAGMYPPQQGSVRLNGIDPFRLHPSQRRALIGIVPQQPHIFSGSLFDNIALRDEGITAEQVERLLERLGFWQSVRPLPQGIATPIGEGGEPLSHGQIQLIALARALITDPPLLLLDELSAGLDSRSEQQILALLRQLCANRTVITISHRLADIIDADTLFFLDHGRIVESGSAAELTSGEGWYAMYRRLEESGWKSG